jgi:hypothetical protein
VQILTFPCKPDNQGQARLARVLLAIGLAALVLSP